MNKTRRDFIKQSGSALIGVAGINALQPKLLYGVPKSVDYQPPTLVVLYLRGGADPLNTFVPHGDSLYYEKRPTIAVPRRGVLALNDYFGFHPAMRPLAELYKQGMVAPILCAGSTHPTRILWIGSDSCIQ